MKQVVFKMQLNRGCEAEYRKRHEEIWPELVTLLKQNGIKDYSIYYDKETGMLIGIQQLDEAATTDLSHEPLMQKWWAQMIDLMDVNADNSPVLTNLEKIFTMP